MISDKELSLLACLAQALANAPVKARALLAVASDPHQTVEYRRLANNMVEAIELAKYNVNRAADTLGDSPEGKLIRWALSNQKASPSGDRK